MFLDPRSEGFYEDWDHVANDVVAILRSEAGRDSHDRDLSNLIGTAEPGTKPEEALSLLGSCAATVKQEATATTLEVGRERLAPAVQALIAKSA